MKMVGLYHKRRAERSQSKVLSCMIRAGAAVGGFTVVGFTLVAIFFNGTAIKGPLGSYLSKQTGLDVTIEDAEFSPVYPDVIKLNNVKFGSSTVGELYLEYDISSALSDDELKINDIYINNLKLSKDDLAALSSSKAGYKSIRANAVRFHHTPINTRFLKTKDATIRLNQVSFSDKDGLTFRSGSVASEKLSLFSEQAKSFVVDFEQSPEGMRLNNFSVQMYGGIISGKGMYNQSLAKAESSQAHKAQATDADTKQESSTDDDTKQTASNNADTKQAPSIDTAQKLLTDIKLDELSLANVIIYSGLTSPENITLTSKSTILSDVILSDDAPSARKTKSSSTKNTSTLAAAKTAENAADKGGKQGSTPKADDVNLSTYIVQGINGKIEDLKITSSGMQGTFNGSADEISMPNLQTTMESNEVSATFSKDALSFKLQGNVYEGRYLAQGALDHKNKELNLEKLLMKKAKLAINTPRLKFLSAALNDYTFNLRHAGFESLEFLSYLNSLPMSIQSITGTVDNLSIKGQASKQDQDEFYRLLSCVSPLKDNVFADTKEGNTEDKADADDNASNSANAVDKVAKRANTDAKASGADMELEFKNFLYSDLLISRMHSKWTLDEDKLLVEVPEAKFKESSVAAEALIALKAFDKSHIKLNAPNFESADLNSNLVSHMLTGKMDVNLSLESKAQAKTFESLINEASGVLKINSDGMLISDFGLDLINGGKDKNYELSYTEMLTGVQGAVAGISALKSTTTFNQGVAQNTTSMALSTATMRLSFNADYERNKISGNSFFISPAKDSSTKVTILGELDEPRFKIIPLRRGEQRPGLYLPQYDENAKAKEQTDAAAVLNGKVKIEEPKQTDDEKKQPQETSLDAKQSTAAAQDLPSNVQFSTEAQSNSNPQTDKDNEQAIKAANTQTNEQPSKIANTESKDEKTYNSNSSENATKDTANAIDSTQEAKVDSAANVNTKDDGTKSSAVPNTQGSEAKNKAQDKNADDSPDSAQSSNDSPSSNENQDSHAQVTDTSSKDTPSQKSPAITNETSALSGDPTENLNTQADQASAASATETTNQTNARSDLSADTTNTKTVANTDSSNDKSEASTSPSKDHEEASTDSSKDPEEASTDITKANDEAAASVAKKGSDDIGSTEKAEVHDEAAASEKAKAKDGAVASESAKAKEDAANSESNKDAASISAEEQAEADKTEVDLLKNVLIDSFFDNEEGEEELIF